MKIAICDDEKKASEALLEILRECPESVEKTDVYFSGEELLRAKEQYDLLFLDIDMEGIDGIETARKIRLKDKKVKIVYVTAYSEYAGKAFSVHAFGYLLKPVKRKKSLGRWKMLWLIRRKSRNLAQFWNLKLPREGPGSIRQIFITLRSGEERSSWRQKRAAMKCREGSEIFGKE